MEASSAEADITQLPPWVRAVANGRTLLPQIPSAIFMSWDANVKSPTSSRMLRSVRRRRYQPAPEATAEPAPQRHVLPKNLRKAVKHLSDAELDLLHAATLEEMKRRGRLPPSVGADSEQSSRHPVEFAPKRLSKGRPVDTAEVSLTRGQVNAVRSAFKAGITPARIARQFGISQSNVRKALASDEAKW